jgi:type I restriction enzyme S subunit
MREDWKVKTLSDVCNIYNGSTPLRSKKEFWENGNINWFTINDIRTQGRIINYTSQKISEEGFENSSLKILPPKTILLCCTASVGEYAISNIELTTNQQFNGLVVKENGDLFSEYLFYFASTLKKQLLDISGKTTIDFVSMTKLKKIQIPIPTLSEQKQIVAILDQAFTAIDQAKANIEKNIENAKELFQSKLNEIFSQKGDGWEEKSLSEVCQIQPPKAEARKELGKNEMVSFVPMKEMGINEMYFKSAQYKELQEVSNSYTYFKNNDVLLAKITPCFENGKLGIAQGLINNIGFGSSEYIVYRPSGNLLPEFLYHFLNQQTFRENGARVMTGAVGHKRIPKEFYEGYKIKIPSLPEQKEILSKMNDLSTNSEKIKDDYYKKLILLEELKKSILQKAFSGELTGKELAVEVD